MTVSKQISKWILIVFLLLATQITTYLLLGPRLLKSKLLPDYFSGLTHHSDSVFVRDFYVAECMVGTSTYFSHHLKKDEIELKEKFGVKYIYIQNRDNFTWGDKTSDNYNLVYYTWADRTSWWWTVDLFNARQTEILLVDKMYHYERRATYRWCLFFWVKTFEWFQFWDIRNRRETT